jgi:hypothetical protein
MGVFSSKSLRSQRRSGVGRILAPALALALCVAGVAVAQTRTGQSPRCERFCMAVEPGTGPEGSVFRFKGRGWRPERRVTVWYGPYCRPDEACPEIAYIARLRTNDRGRFTFRLRAGDRQPGDAKRKIVAGAHPVFEQRVGERRVSRTPRYRVTLPG